MSDHPEWYNVLGTSSIQGAQEKCRLHYCKKYSLLGQSDSVTLTKWQHACCGGWTEWWKQWQAYIYSNANLKYDVLWY